MLPARSASVTSFRSSARKLFRNGSALPSSSLSILTRRLRIRTPCGRRQSVTPSWSASQELNAWRSSPVMAVRSRRVTSLWVPSSGSPGSSAPWPSAVLSSFRPTAESARDLAAFAVTAVRPAPIGPSGVSAPATAAPTAPATPSGTAPRIAAPSTLTPARSLDCLTRLSAYCIGVRRDVADRGSAPADPASAPGAGGDDHGIRDEEAVLVDGAREQGGFAFRRRFLITILAVPADEDITYPAQFVQPSVHLVPPGIASFLLAMGALFPGRPTAALEVDRIVLRVELGQRLRAENLDRLPELRDPRRIVGHAYHRLRTVPHRLPLQRLSE